MLTGMLPYKSLGGDAPLADAFTSKGLQYVSVLISIGAIAGLTTTLLVGLYVQVYCFYVKMLMSLNKLRIWSIRVEFSL